MSLIAITSTRFPSTIGTPYPAMSLRLGLALEYQTKMERTVAACYMMPNHSICPGNSVTAQVVTLTILSLTNE